MPKSERSQVSVGSGACSRGRTVAISWSEKVAGGVSGAGEGEFGRVY